MSAATRHISIDAIRDAATAVYRAAIRTPLVRVEVPGAPAGLDLYLKLEVLQPIGSFKIRGAVNVVRQLSASDCASGVWTVSAGNAALGVAYAARRAGVPCSVMVMDTAPATRVFAAEPDTAAPLSASLAAGRPVYFDNWRASFVDGAGGKSVLETMWPLLRQVKGSIVVTLDAVAGAIRLVAERAHVIAEGAAGCAVAAALSGRAGTGKIAAIVSGGNIDLARFVQLIDPQVVKS